MSLLDHPATDHRDHAATEDLRSSDSRAGAPLGARLVLPGEPGWDDARRAWNLAVDQRPAAVAFAESAQDVIAVVEFARARGLRVAPQGTGHNAGALATLEDTILLKTSRMRQVTIDPVRRTARAEAGALWMDVTGPAGEHGLAALAGSSPDVGVVGYCLGGGVSWLGRRHGLACNSVVAVELVTADGRLIRASHDEHPELFWAVRGGGGSFGIVTAIELALYDHAQVFAGALFFPWGRAREVLHAWRTWTTTVADTVGSCGRILQVPPFPDIPEPLRGRQFALIEVVVIGDAEAGAMVVEPLRALEPEIDTLAMLPVAALDQLHMDPEQPVPGIGGGALLAELPAAAIDALVEVAGPTSGTSLLTTEIRHLGGALARDPQHRGALGSLAGEYMMFCGGVPVDAEAGAAVTRDVAAARAALQPWDAGYAYLNFVEEPTAVSRFFGEEDLARLRAVKRRFDPTDLIRSNHPIPPA